MAMSDEEFYNAICDDAVGLFRAMQSLAIVYRLEDLTINVIDEMWYQIAWKHKSTDPIIEKAKGVIRLTAGWARFNIVMSKWGFKHTYNVGFDGSVN